MPKQSPRLFEQEFAIFGENDAAIAAQHERRPDFGFEIGEVNAERRLRDIEPLARSDEAARLRDGDEISKLP
jgi:hypothetical protein